MSTLRIIRYGEIKSSKILESKSNFKIYTFVMPQPITKTRCFDIFKTQKFQISQVNLQKFQNKSRKKITRKRQVELWQSPRNEQQLTELIEKKRNWEIITNTRKKHWERENVKQNKKRMRGEQQKKTRVDCRQSAGHVTLDSHLNSIYAMYPFSHLLCGFNIIHITWPLDSTNKK